MPKALHDPIRPKKIKKGHQDGQVDSPLLKGEFRAPSYDNRTSCSVSAGDEYGVGFKTPVGKEKASNIDSGPIPQKAYALSPDRIFYGKGAEDERG